MGCGRGSTTYWRPYRRWVLVWIGYESLINGAAVMVDEGDDRGVSQSRSRQL